jgi:hypothetical protein
MGLHKIKMFMHITRKKTTRIKRQPTEWEKIFSSYSTAKGLISKLHKELKKTEQQNNKEPN